MYLLILKTGAKIFQLNLIIDQLTIKLPAPDFGHGDIWGIYKIAYWKTYDIDH